MDATLAWEIVGSVAGVATVGASVVFGVLQLRQGRERRRSTTRADVFDSGATDGSGARDSLDVKARSPSAILQPPVGRLPMNVRGRSDLIGRLVRLAEAPDGRVHVLYGMGGTGKSTIALEVANLRQKAHGRVWWVPAGDEAALVESLMDLARDLGAKSSEIRDALAGQANPADILWQRLEATHGWLLVLDNADNPAVLSAGHRAVQGTPGWLRPTRSGLVLVTSRDGSPERWGRSAVIHPIRPLADNAGVDVLLDLAPDAGDRAEAALLAQRLGGLPLALRLAGSYLHSPFASERTFSEYAQALTNRSKSLVADSDLGPSLIGRTFQLSLDMLAERGQLQAQSILRVLSCFASGTLIPSSLLTSTVFDSYFGGHEQAEAGLAGLSTVGLIEGPASDDGAGRLQVMVHPLVAESVQQQASDALAESHKMAVHLLASGIDRLVRDDPENQAEWLALLPHLRSLLSLNVATPPTILVDLARSAAAISVVLLRDASYLAVLEVAESALERCSQLGRDHTQILNLHYYLASAHRFLKQSAAAETEFRQVRDTQRRVLGPDDPRTLATWYEVARMLAAQDRPADAETEYRQVLDTQRRVLGPDDPRTLATRHSIANVLAAQNRPADAETEYRQLLDTQRRVLGPDDPRTLATWYEVARMLAAQDRPADAETEYRQVLDTQRRVLGPDDPRTLATRHSIANVLAAQNRPADAETEYRQLLDTQRRVLGPDDPRTLATWYEVARMLAAQDRPADAETEYRQLLDTQRRVLGPDDPRTLATRHSIANVLAAQNRPADAETEFRQLLDTQRRVLGAGHPATRLTELSIQRLRQGND